jgi:hypothetical protein
MRRPSEVALPARQVHDQRDVNCCFSCALSSAVEARDPAMPPLAPLYHFHFAGGARVIREGLTDVQAKLALMQHGICALDRHRFPIAAPNVSKVPDADAVRDGIRRRPMDRQSGTLLWRRVGSTDPSRSWKRILSAGAPIVIGFQTNADYQALNAQRPVLADNRGPYDAVGHAAVILGYRDAMSAFVVQDSRRGTDFGVGGQWFLPYDMATAPFVVMALALASDE